tara:strand:- start:58 stop:426 length:369 start_codon:yes stop_codon:yes gene_type:complete
MVTNSITLHAIGAVDGEYPFILTALVVDEQDACCPAIRKFDRPNSCAMPPDDISIYVLLALSPNITTRPLPLSSVLPVGKHMYAEEFIAIAPSKVFPASVPKGGRTLGTSPCGANLSEALYQ